jgi:acetoin utilization deacetylase AcuC-like enzyme
MLPIAFDSTYCISLPEGHRFPMLKYELLPAQLLYEGTVTKEQLFKPDRLEIKHALQVHNPQYLNRLLELKLTPREQRISGFPHSQALVERELIIMEGTRKCAELAFQNKTVAFNIAGGTHHAYTDRGEGFCLLNDQAIAAKWLLNSTNCQKILIIDLDVHQGNGTAEIFQKDSAVFTFSMHGANNYPLHKEKSTLDVPLKDGISDGEYLEILHQNLAVISSQFKPDFIFYQAGVDVLASDKLGRMNLSLDACKKRDEIVFLFTKQLNLPVVCTMGGGYSPEIKTIIEAHANTFRVAMNTFEE